MPFSVRVGEFDGPLDLLLGLIEERKMYINEVALSTVTDSYLEHMSALQVPLAETAQFVLVASTLLLIKPRSLLPTLEVTEDERADIKELEDRLQKYRAIKEGARVLAREWGRAPQRFPSRSRIIRLPVFTPTGVTLERLRQTLRALVTLLPVETFRQTATVEAVVSLEEMIDRLKAKIQSSVSMRFSQLRSGSKVEVVIQFLALLELVKSGFVMVEQSRAFDDILVETEGIGTPRYGV